MAAKIVKITRLLRLYARMDLRFMMQDLFTAAVMILSETVLGLSALAGTALVAVRFGGMGTLTSDEVLFFLAFHLFSQGVEVMLWGGFNVIEISRRIGRAQVDHMLIQPIPIWMQLFTEGFMPFSGCPKFLCGVAALILSVPRAGIAVTPSWLALLFALTLARITLHISVAYLAGCTAFYSPVGCEEMSDVALSLCDTVIQFPLSGMPGTVQKLLFTVAPLGLFTYLPALILLSRADAVLAAWPLLAALVLAQCAQKVFKKGMKHYVKNGCARYKSMGYRC